MKENILVELKKILQERERDRKTDIETETEKNNETERQREKCGEEKDNNEERIKDDEKLEVRWKKTRDEEKKEEKNGLNIFRMKEWEKFHSKKYLAQWAGAVKYNDCILAEG